MTHPPPQSAECKKHECLLAYGNVYKIVFPPNICVFACAASFKLSLKGLFEDACSNVFKMQCLFIY